MLMKCAYFLHEDNVMKKKKNGGGGLDVYILSEHFPVTVVYYVLYVKTV